MGINIFFVMQCIGELATLYPSAGAFTEHCGRFVDGAVAVSLGWNYWYLVSTAPMPDFPGSCEQWAINLAAEYNLIAVVLGYWTDKVPDYGWILMAWAFYQGIGLLGITVFGEVEFWLALIKIVFVLVTFLLSILCNTGAIGGDYVGFRYWSNPGPVINGINGFGKSFVLSAVYYSGTELVAITAGESRNPHRAVPSV
jgi:yeast amino acid transporter